MRRGQQKVTDVARIEVYLLLRCVTRHDGRPIAETEELKLSSLSNKATRTVRKYILFIAIVKSEMNFSAAFTKDDGVFCLAARIVDNVDNMALFEFLTANIPQTCQCYIPVTGFLLHHSNNFSTIEDIVEKTGFSTLRVSHFDCASP